jgi:DICT domain-containing protein
MRTPWHVGFFDVLKIVPPQYTPVTDIDVYTICAADGQHLAYVRGTAADKSIAMKMAVSPELLMTLQELDKRLRSCFVAGITTQEAYDSFYQENVAEVIAKATGGDV